MDPEEGEEERAISGDSYLLDSKKGKDKYISFEFERKDGRETKEGKRDQAREGEVNSPGEVVFVNF